MVRFLVLATAALFATAVSAQTVLLQHMPTYKSGEYAIGALVDQQGGSYKVFQFAEVKAGKTYLNMVILDQSGKVVQSSRVDFGTLLGEDKIGDTVIKTISSSCASAMFYPLIAGKQYECVAEHESGTGRYSSKSTVVFRTVTDRLGQPAGYCGKAKMDNPNVYMVSESCFTPDGKWMTRLRILEYEIKRPA